MKLMIKVNFIGCLLFGILILVCVFYLQGWNERNLNPCCFKMCGATHSFEECLPCFIVSLFYIIGFGLIMFAILNVIFGLSEKEGK